CYQAIHHQFVASALAVKRLKELSPDSQIGCMIARLTSYPATCHPDDVMKNALEDQYHNFFYLDVQVKAHYPSYMHRFFQENNVSIVITEEDENILRENIVDFTSVRYYVTASV